MKREKKTDPDLSFPFHLDWPELNNLNTPKQPPDLGHPLKEIMSNQHFTFVINIGHLNKAGSLDFMAVNSVMWLGQHDLGHILVS